MTAPRVRVWRGGELGMRMWFWRCPVCRPGTTRLCHSHATALDGALHHLASQHHPSGASSTPRR